VKLNSLRSQAERSLSGAQGAAAGIRESRAEGPEILKSGVSNRYADAPRYAGASATPFAQCYRPVAAIGRGRSRS
jgi:hypothetical protein